MKNKIKLLLFVSAVCTAPITGDSIRDIFTEIKPDMFKIDPRYGRPDPDQYLFDPNSPFKMQCLAKIDYLRSRAIDKDAIAIGQEDIGAYGLVIGKSGAYYLKESIVFNPPESDDAVAAITIKAPHVTLFLNGQSLTHVGFTDASEIPYYGSGARKPSQQQPDVTGILMASDLELWNVNIIGNGALIEGFSRLGIRVLSNASEISIIDLTIRNCGNAHSYYLRTNNFNTSEGDLSFGGIRFGENPEPVIAVSDGASTLQNHIGDLVIANVHCLNNYLYGCCMSNVKSFYLGNSSFLGTYSDDPSVDPFAWYLNDQCVQKFEMDAIVCNDTMCKW